MPQQDNAYEEFFGSRRRALEARIKEINSEIEALQTEQRLAQAELGRLIKAIEILEAKPNKEAYTSKFTIKQGVMQVLKETPNGLTAMQILERLRLDLNMSYERTSLSPQLSRLKVDGKIKYEGGIWHLNS